MTSTKLPWMKFSPSKWRADASLRMCSLAARGLWIELLGLMHEAAPYGHLLVEGKKPSEGQLANVIGTDHKLVRTLLAELGAAGVYSITDEGIIFSRRMVRDAEKAEKDKANGSSGGNPNLKKDKRGVNPKSPNRDNAEGVAGDKAKRLEEREKTSDPIGSGADAPGVPSPSPVPVPQGTPPAIDPVKALFDKGIQQLGDTPAARSLVGKWRKEFNDAVVLECLVECERHAPTVPVEWMVKALAARPKKGAVTVAGVTMNAAGAATIAAGQRLLERRAAQGQQS